MARKSLRPKKQPGLTSPHKCLKLRAIYFRTSVAILVVLHLHSATIERPLGKDFPQTPSQGRSFPLFYSEIRMADDILLDMTKKNAIVLESVCMNAAEMVVLAEFTINGDTGELRTLRESFEELAYGLRVRVQAVNMDGSSEYLPIRCRIKKSFAYHLVSAIREFEETRLNGVITQVLVGMMG